MKKKTWALGVAAAALVLVPVISLAGLSASTAASIGVDFGSAHMQYGAAITISLTSN